MSVVDEHGVVSGSDLSDDGAAHPGVVVNALVPVVARGHDLCLGLGAAKKQNRARAGSDFGKQVVEHSFRETVCGALLEKMRGGPSREIDEGRVQHPGALRVELVLKLGDGGVQRLENFGGDRRSWLVSGRQIVNALVQPLQSGEDFLIRSAFFGNRISTSRHVGSHKQAPRLRESAGEPAARSLYSNSRRRRGGRRSHLPVPMALWGGVEDVS